MVRKMNEALYKAIIDNTTALADKWLKMRKRVPDSIYSADAEGKYEELLREQNALTTKTIASSLLDDKTEYELNLEKWAGMVATSRADLGTPIFEVLEAVQNFRQVIMDFLNEFVLENETEITKQNILDWSQSIHNAFDMLMQEFSQLYYYITRERMKAQHELISELGAPVIPIGDNVAVLPLIGSIDTERARRLMETVPVKCIEKQVNKLFIDLSGVPIVDTMVAQQIYSIIQSLSLLGITTSLSGIRPEVAMTSIQLGIDLSEIKTFSTLKQALHEVGMRIES
jgi:rsbT co-antagonist protein RsbR